MTINKKIALYQSRIEKGIKWLDKNEPGWFKKINLKTLDLSDGKKCIVGQTFKGFFTKVAEKWETPEVDQISFSKATQLGFALLVTTSLSNEQQNEDDHNHNYDLLTALWYSRLQTYKRPR